MPLICVARFPLAIALVLLTALSLAGCRTSSAPESAPTTATPNAEAPTTAAPQITFGNGDANWIVIDGMTRTGSTLTFSEVRIDGNGWLVIHPFEGGKPVGEIYVGSTYLGDGANHDVDITVESGIEAGDMFLVMLHRDVNENQKFDFVFVDERNVLDKAVFEGTKMIAHPIAAP
jgi:hypothetical protein